MARSQTKIKSKDNILDYILLVIFIGVIIVTLYPFLNVLAISFNDPIDTMRNINFIIPRKFTWSNYTYVFQENNLFEPFAMSIVRTLIGTLTGVAATAMVAYVLSRRDFYFNKLFTVLFDKFSFLLNIDMSGSVFTQCCDSIFCLSNFFFPVL